MAKVKKYHPIKLTKDSIAHVSKDVSPKTIKALKTMISLAQKQIERTNHARTNKATDGNG